MAGSYCRYCGNRCFVERRLPAGHSCSDLCRVVGHSWHMATCPDGMAHDRLVTGYDQTTAINPHAEAVTS